ncbi:hypothetical protein [Nocardia jiangxiensis]|uniref:hypothetical protein n=1 Tax=Nocardia jiangxiensis TaxID=282685 RepID=UPI0002DC2453|nr:hypothetical protein [Nocardia jiangxiensis]
MGNVIVPHLVPEGINATAGQSLAAATTSAITFSSVQAGTPSAALVSNALVVLAGSGKVTVTLTINPSGSTTFDALYLYQNGTQVASVTPTTNQATITLTYSGAVARGDQFTAQYHNNNFVAITVSSGALSFVVN